MQTAAIRTVANSLPQNEVILLTLLISNRYILFAELLNKNENQDCLHDKAAIYLFRFMQFKTNGVVILFLSLE